MALAQRASMCHATTTRGILQNIIWHSVPIDRIPSPEEERGERHDDVENGAAETNQTLLSADVSHGREEEREKRGEIIHADRGNEERGREGLFNGREDE